MKKINIMVLMEPGMKNFKKVTFLCNTVRHNQKLEKDTLQ